MKDEILKWFITGRTGASSKAMASAAIGLQYCKSHPYPHDPSDFNRCLLLLDSVPEIRQHMEKIAAISDTWAKLVNRWDEIEKCFLDEVGLDWTKGESAPRTYNLMRSIIKGSEQ